MLYLFGLAVERPTVDNDDHLISLATYFMYVLSYNVQSLVIRMLRQSCNLHLDDCELSMPLAQVSLSHT